MKYEYECDECELTDVVDCRMGQAPETITCTLCGGTMHRVFSCNFVLHGSDWPSKELRNKRAGENHEVIERDDRRREELYKDQELQNEVLAERRKGRESWKTYKRKHPKKVDRYNENLQRGMRGE